MINPKTRVDRIGDWCETYTGIEFYPCDPHLADINIVDIAHALSMLCRFGGACREFYSVAQHSVLVSKMCDPNDALWGLLHDAGEAYVCDLPKPIKHMHDMKPYRDIEHALMVIIAAKFGLESDEPESVRVADKRMCATEGAHLMSSKCTTWRSRIEPYDFAIVPVAPSAAETMFLERFRELTKV